MDSQLRRARIGAENCFERTGFAVEAAPDDFVAVAGPLGPVGRTLRYLSVARLPEGLRLYVEAASDDSPTNSAPRSCRPDVLFPQPAQWAPLS